MKWTVGLVAAAVFGSSNADTIVETVVGSEEYSILEQAVLKAEVASLLTNVTVFAPTNEAFGTIGAIGEHLLKPQSNYTKDLLTDVLAAHVIPERRLAETLIGKSVPSLFGYLLNVTADEVNGVSINKTDIVLDDGVVHQLNGVIVPAGFPAQTIAETAEGAEDFSILVAALAEEDLDTPLFEAQNNTWTVFAPTDAAFEKLLNVTGLTKQQLLKNKNLARILKQHAVSGTYSADELKDLDTVETLNGEIDVQKVLASVTATVRCLNGLVHVVDTVILPSDGATIFNIVSASAATTTLKEKVSKFDDIVGLFSSLESSITAFAPLDTAFDKLATKGILAHLNSPDEYYMGLLKSVLTYHVVDGAKNANELSAKETTVNGGLLAFNGTHVNNATVIAKDIQALNGVVHAIDTVLIPEDFPALTIGEMVDQSSTLFKALVKTGLASLFVEYSAATEKPWTVFAPSDAAFGNLLKRIDATEEELFVNKLALPQILSAHVIIGAYMKDDIAANETISTLAGEIEVANISLSENLDVQALNGYIHFVDQVILPPGFVFVRPTLLETVESVDTLSSLLSLVGKFDDLVGAVSDPKADLTVFAPLNSAFADAHAVVDHLVQSDKWYMDLLKSVLTYHILPAGKSSTELNETEVTLGGGSVEIKDGKVNGVNITMPNVRTENGYAHVIDSVLLPEGFPVKTIKQTLEDDGYKLLIAALVALGGDDEVEKFHFPAETQKPWTLFVPTDKAFSDALTALDLTIEELLGNKEVLGQILSVHVVEGAFSKEQVAKLENVPTTGGDLPLKTIVDALETPDIKCLNGYIHVVNSVLLPTDFTLPGSEAPTSDSAKFNVVPQMVALTALVMNMLL